MECGVLVLLGSCFLKVIAVTAQSGGRPGVPQRGPEVAWACI